MTSYTTIAGRDLTTEHYQQWSDMLVGAPPPQDSAFFHPEFTRVIASVRRDVEVAVMQQDGRTVGFFPFQRSGRGIQPVVGRLSEFHGAITTPDAQWSAIDLFRACQIGAWHFDHLPTTQTEFVRYAWGYQDSPYLDLSSGYDTCRETQRKSGSSWSQTERKARKLEREVGPLRFEWHTADSQPFEALIDWKSEQHRRTGVLEIFRQPWVAAMLDAFRHTEVPGFSAPLAALYAGDRLVAVHLGLCTPRALHIWFPTFDVQYEAYSPGLVLLLKMAEAAAARGIVRIDFGPSEARYKINFSSGSLPVAEGMASPNGMQAQLRGMWFRTKRAIRQSAYREQLERPLVMTRRFRQWLAFR